MDNQPWFQGHHLPSPGPTLTPDYHSFYNTACEQGAGPHTWLAWHSEPLLPSMTSILGTVELLPQEAFLLKTAC